CRRVVILQPMNERGKRAEKRSQQRRLGAALRENLRRRKAQAKARASGSGAAGAGKSPDSAGIARHKQERQTRAAPLRRVRAFPHRGAAVRGSIVAFAGHGGGGMDRIRIYGGQRLNGTIPISGAKNATLPLMIASLLTDKTLVLDNVPRLADVSLLQR